jgi:hypothetical protein
MRLAVGGALLSFATLAAARSSYDQMEDYRRALETQHIDGEPEKAKAETEELLKEVDPNSPVFPAIVRSNQELSGAKEGDLDPAEVAFATGHKTEYYCKDKGLVYMEGQHNDGSWSKLVLVKSQREMIGDSYSQSSDGQWTFEMSNSFRAPTRSQLWQTYGKPNAFNIFEVRDNADGHTDKGSWDSSWEGDNHSSRYSVTSGGDEPVRMHMALHYHLWGSNELGYSLKFEPGYKDRIKSEVHGSKSGRIPLQATRYVEEHLPSFTYEDSTGASYTADDCYKVTAAINLRAKD